EWEVSQDSPFEAMVARRARRGKGCRQQRGGVVIPIETRVAPTQCPPPSQVGTALGRILIPRRTEPAPMAAPSLPAARLSRPGLPVGLGRSILTDGVQRTIVTAVG